MIHCVLEQFCICFAWICEWNVIHWQSSGRAIGEQNYVALNDVIIELRRAACSVVGLT